MPHVISEEAKGQSDKSFMDALLDAIRQGLKSIGLSADIKVTIIIEGAVIEGDKHKVSIKLVTLSLNDDLDMAYHEKPEDYEDRIEGNHHLLGQYHAAVNNDTIYEQSKTEDYIKHILEEEGYHFDGTEDGVILISDPNTHAQFERDIESRYVMQKDTAPTLDMVDTNTTLDHTRHQDSGDQT